VINGSGAFPQPLHTHLGAQGSSAQQAEAHGWPSCARHRFGVRALERGAQARRWGAPGQAATAHVSTCRKRKRSARRPACRQARCCKRRIAPRHASIDEDHRQAPATVDGRGLDLSAGVRTATTSSPTSLHKNYTTRRPVHKSLRHGACARHTAWRRGMGWPSVHEYKALHEGTFTRASDTAAWGGYGATAQQGRRRSSIVHGVTAAHRRSAARRHSHRQG
jgi:hypothetical protein